jgi:hypothetical protein
MMFNIRSKSFKIDMLEAEVDILKRECERWEKRFEELSDQHKRYAKHPCPFVVGDGVCHRLESSIEMIVLNVSDIHGRYGHYGDSVWIEPHYTVTCAVIEDGKRVVRSFDAIELVRIEGK